MEILKRTSILTFLVLITHCDISDADSSGKKCLIPKDEINETQKCPFTPKDFKFLHLPVLPNETDLNTVKIHRNWPCEVVRFTKTGWFSTCLRFLMTLYEYILPVIILVGVGINILALMSIHDKQRQVIRSRGPVHKSIVYVLSTYQCWFDMGALLLNCVPLYARSHFNELFMANIVLCRSYKVLVTIFEMASPWLNVVIASIRWLDVKWPMNRVSTTTLRWTVRFLFIVAMGIAMTKIWYSGFEEYSALYRRCEKQGRTNIFVTSIYVALSTLLPGVFSIVINFLLISAIVKNKYERIVQCQEKKATRKKQCRRIIIIISSMSLSYVIVIALGIMEGFELYWNLSERKAICRLTDRKAFIEWRKKKLIFWWTRSLLYLVSQLCYVINFSCSLLTTEDLWKIGKRMFSPLSLQLPSRTESMI